MKWIEKPTTFIGGHYVVAEINGNSYTVRGIAENEIEAKTVAAETGLTALLIGHTITLPGGRTRQMSPIFV